MRVCVVGSGGREHALAHVLARTASVVVAPGNAGMTRAGIETTEPVEVPAIAAYYSTDSPGRISSRPLEELEREVMRLQEKLAALGP